MSLRDRLETKQRRRLVVPVQVSDPAQDHGDLTAVMQAFHLAQQRDASDEELAGLQTQMDELAEKVRSHWVEIELQSLSAGEWEIAAANWQTIEVNEDGPVATMDWSAALAPLLAESCTDPELKDGDWWAEQLAKDQWSEGDIEALRAAVLRLNIDAVGSQAPKD